MWIAPDDSSETEHNELVRRLQANTISIERAKEIQLTPPTDLIKPTHSKTIFPIMPGYGESEAK